MNITSYIILGLIYPYTIASLNSKTIVEYIPNQEEIVICSIKDTHQTSISNDNYLVSLFSTDRWPARWYCGEWTPFEGWFYIGSDIAISLAYYAIPFMLLLFTWKQKNIPFRKYFLMFSAFIMFCGTTHLIDAIIFWEPVYRLNGVVKFLTAGISCYTAIAMIQGIPFALTLRTPHDLQREIDEKQLALSRLYAYIKFVPYATVMLDKDLNYIEVSESWKKMFRVGDDDLTGKSYYDTFPWILENPEWLDFHQRAINGESISRERDELSRPDGTKGFFKWKMSPWFEPGGNIGGIIIYCDQLDKLVKEETERKRKEKLLTETSSLARIGAWELDLETNETIITDTIYEIHEMPKNHKMYLDKSIGFYRNDHQPIIQKAVNDAIEFKKPYDLELVIKTMKGKQVWVRTTGQPVIEGGKVVRLRGLFQDINQRKKAILKVQEKTKEIQLSNDRLNAFIENFPGIAFTLSISGNRNSKLLHISKGCKELTGYTARELKAKDGLLFKQLIMEQDQNRILKQFQSRVNNYDYEIRYRILTKDRQIKWCMGKGRLLVNSENKDATIEGMIIDITESAENDERVLAAMMNGADRERRRIAEEMHDGVQQTLTTSQILFESVKPELKSLTKKKRDNFLQAYELLGDGINDARELAHNIMPKSIKDFGLVPAIKSLLSRIAESENIQVNFYENLDGFRMKIFIEMHLFRCIQTAVNNVLRHAEATSLSIQLIKNKKNLSLMIEDNGKGFDHNIIREKNTESLGLFTMESRIHLISGTIDISTGIGKGTNISIELPLPTINS